MKHIYIPVRSTGSSMSKTIVFIILGITIFILFVGIVGRKWIQNRKPEDNNTAKVESLVNFEPSIPVTETRLSVNLDQSIIKKQQKQEQKLSCSHNGLSKVKKQKTHEKVEKQETQEKEKKTMINPSQEYVMPTLEPKQSRSISVHQFAQYCAEVMANNNIILVEEYKKLKMDSTRQEKIKGLSQNIGRMTENTSKNRFTNILPFDQTRVVLEKYSFPDNYINANFIPFTNDDKKYEYIAAQGPNDQSVSDFWQMIWEQNINFLVMLTRTVEENKLKCLQYWPEDVGAKLLLGTNEEIEVLLEKQCEDGSHITRTLMMTNKEKMDSRQIIQIHMMSWFDYSAPNLQDFDKMMFKYHEITYSFATPPYLVHCSAGVGRTGTLICIDRIIRQLVNGGQVIDIYNTVLELRAHRSMMVQRQTQYIFIHDYINHFLAKYIDLSNNKDVYFNEDK